MTAIVLLPSVECIGKRNHSKYLISVAYFFNQLVLVEIKPSRFYSANFNIALIINKTCKVCGFK